jgi:hypothetical protein
MPTIKISIKMGRSLVLIQEGLQPGGVSCGSLSVSFISFDILSQQK